MCLVDILQENSKLRAGGHGFSIGNLPAISQSYGSRPVHHGSRGKVDRKIKSSPADNTRVPYIHNNHHYHYQRHTGHIRTLQHKSSQHLEEKDTRSYHHKQSTVRITYLIIWTRNWNIVGAEYPDQYLVEVQNKNECSQHLFLCSSPSRNSWCCVQNN